MSGHRVEVRRTYAVCLTCGAVAKVADALAHVVETYFAARRAS